MRKRQQDGRQSVCERREGDTRSVPEVAMCLNAGGMGRIDGESETFVAESVGFDNRQGAVNDISITLRSQCHGATPMVTHPEIGWNGDTTPKFGRDVAPTMRREQGGEGYGVVTPSMVVRRLTPEECEALQAFPRGYTAIEYRGKPAADGPRYKALGNSMCVNVIAWIGNRIRKAIEEVA